LPTAAALANTPEVGSFGKPPLTPSLTISVHAQPRKAA